MYRQQIWFVVQHTKIVNSKNEIDARVKELYVEYGPEVKFKYISKNYKIRKTKKDVTKMFNIVCGTLLKTYKNENLLFDEIVKDNYNGKTIRFDFKPNAEGSYVVLSGLTDLELCWIYNFVRSQKFKESLFLNYKNHNLQFYIRNYNFIHDKNLKEESLQLIKEIIKENKKNTLFDLSSIILNYAK